MAWVVQAEHRARNQLADIINIAEIAPRDWTFVKDSYRRQNDTWHFFMANAHEKKGLLGLLPPEAHKIIAATRGVLGARDSVDTVFISHMPRTTLYVEILRRLLKPKSRHIGFSFNFTEMPKSWDLWLMRRFLGGLSKLIVYSTYEVKLYSGYFDLPDTQFQFIPWCMNLKIERGAAPKHRYICAAGGEGREFHTLIKAARELPDVTFKLVTRPGKVDEADLPKNIELLVNLPYDQFWKTVANSYASVIALSDKSRCNGHITAVGSQLLGVPVIASDSDGLTDYIRHEETGLLFETGSEQCLTACLRKLLDDEDSRAALAKRAQRFAEATSNEQVWANLVEELIHHAADPESQNKHQPL